MIIRMQDFINFRLDLDLIYQFLKITMLQALCQ